MPEDMPEDGCWPPVVNKSPETKGVKDYINKFYTEEWLFALVSQGFTFGWTISGFPPSILLACFCWTVTLVVVLHFFWVWSRGKIKRWFSAAMIICVSIILIFFSWRPVKTRYIAEHSPAPPTPAEAFIMNTLTNKPTVQLFALYSEPRSTNIVMLRTNNQVFEEVNISEKEVIDALNPATNNNVDLGKSRDINLGFMVLGDGIADGVQVQLLTPWVDDGGNITGESRWWRDAGRVQLMDSQTHTFTYTHSMMCSMDVPVNPWTSVPIPTLHIPDNYTNNVLYTIWRVDSKSTHEEYIKVAFHLH